MIRNYLKIAWRTIVKRPFFSLMNIAGLSAGIAFTLLIGGYVWNELRMNRDLRHADRQFIIQSKWKDPNQGYELASLGQLAKAVKENYPQLVADYYRYDGITTNISRGEKSFREGVQIGDSTLLKMYGFRLAYGDAHSALRDPNSVVITSEAAIKYFGKPDAAVGQSLTIENFAGSRREFQVTGVLAALSRGSVTQLVDDFRNDFFMAESALPFFGRSMDWSNIAIASYVELRPGVSPRDVEQAMRQLVRQHTPVTISGNLSPVLVSLKDYNLVANNGIIRKMLFALSGIALFILLMAIINFVNLSISRASSRMREIGVRKVLGGMKKQLILQFLAESILLVFFSTLIAMVIYLLTSDLFSTILGRPVPALTAFPLYFVVFPVLMILLTGVVAGIYPAFVLSSFRTVESLKGKLASTGDNVLMRKSLVAFQFGMATIVFAGALVVSQQLRYFFGGDLGFDKDFVIAAQVPRNWTRDGVSKMEAVRQQFAGMPELAGVSLSYEVPDGNNSGAFSVYREGADSTTAITSQLMYSDEYFAATYGIRMAAGKFYSEPGAYTDSSAIVINATEAKALGWNQPDDAIGQNVRFPNVSQPFRIAGVTNDFHAGSMKNAIQPVTFFHVGVSNTFRFLSFKIRPGNVSKTLAALQLKWSSLLPGAPFEYRFMDDTLAKVYKTELQLKKAAYTATVLSVIIVLLGIIGLVSLSIQKRTKEMGIRKVLGASVVSIISLFMKEFIWVVLAACMVACPVAWFIMKGWLSDYAYRIELTATPFAMAIAGLGTVTVLLILFQTIRTGLANPVRSLRSE